MRERQRGLQRYFPFYNEERWPQSLDYRTPAAVYRGREADAARLPAWKRGVRHREAWGCVFRGMAPASEGGKKDRLG